MNTPKEIADTVDRHVAELLDLAATGQISIYDHDMVGKVVADNLAKLIPLSNKAWETFVRIINESREVHYRRNPEEKR